jgi:hypothetical protein
MNRDVPCEMYKIPRVTLLYIDNWGEDANIKLNI